MVRRGLAAIFILCAAGASSDAITVGKRAYDDVYITQNRNHYFIHLPDEGRVVKVSRKRQDVTAPVIEKDPARRDEFLRRFQQNRPEPPREAVAGAGSSMSNAAVERHHQVRDLALFEAQLAHWKRLTGEQRLAVDTMLLSKGLGDVGDFMDSVDAMGGDASVLRSKMEAIARGETPQTSAPTKVNGTGSQHAGRAGPAIPREPTVRRHQGDAIALTTRAIEGAQRVLLCKQRIEELSNAMNTGYTPQLNANVIDTWEGTTSRKTNTFSIDSPFWRLECLREDFGLPGKFAVTLYDADTDQPFTRLADLDYLQMRVCLVGGPGRYYLQIEQDESVIPYEIRAVTFGE